MATRSERIPNWLSALAPVLLIALFAVAFVKLDPIGSLRAVPPVETISFERTVLTEGHISLRVRNDGPDTVKIAQVLVNDAYWDYELGDRELGRLESTSIEIDYPWEPGLPLDIGLVTSTGIVLPLAIEAASLSTTLDTSTLTIYALLGLYIGVIPVAVGLLWFPALRRASQKWLTFFLAFTVGLLAFLLVDATVEGFEIAARTGAALNGLGVFFIGALIAIAALMWLSRALDSRQKVTSGLVLSYLISAGIGLHNLGEGLAVGAALTAGEIALGTFLIVGFALHNTTEGLAIVAPLGDDERRPSLWHFVAFGALAGVPTIFGAWIGGFAFSPVWGTFAFGIASGAVAQVIWAIASSMRERAGSGAAALGFCVGLVAMYATGLLT